MKTTKPIFILGNPRSGTTLLRLLLTNHPNIVIAPESSFVIWWKKKYHDWAANDNQDRIDELLNDFFTSKKIEHWNLDKTTLKKSIQTAQPTNYAQLCQLIYLQYAYTLPAKNIKYWGDKNNYYVNCPDQLLKLYPNAYFVHIIRDLRDVVCSYKTVVKTTEHINYAPKLSTDIENIAHEWMENNDRVINFLARLPTQKSISIRYEDVVKNTTQTLTKICHLLDVDYEKSMLDYWKTENQHTFEPENFRGWKNRNFQKIDDSQIGKFNSELSPQVIHQLNDTAHRLLTQFDYL